MQKEDYCTETLITTSIMCSENRVHDASSSLQKKQHTMIGHSEDISQVWNFFARQTTFHGIKNIVSTERGRYSKLLWLLLVTGMSGGMLYTVAEQLVEFYQYNTVTKTDIKINVVSTFPSVTFCNTCPYKNVDHTTDTPLFRLLASQSILTKTHAPFNQSDPDVQTLLESDVFQLQEKYTFKAEDLFLSALYENKPLNVSEAFEPIETIFGRCFTFNGPKYISKHEPRLTSQVGRDSGLRLYVHLFQHDYFVHSDLTAGIRIFVASYPDTPKLRQDGIDIHPGTSTRLALTPVKYTFLPAPYKSYGEKPCQELNITEQRHKMVDAQFYSFDSCLEQCHSQHASMACECNTPLLRVPGLRNCTLKDLINCFLIERDKLTEADCDCPRSCTFTHYDKSLSASQIPSTVSAESLSKLVNVYDATQLREDYLEIRVYLDTMMLRHERHEAQYTWRSIFSFLGGQMGFFIGASLITLAEILETIMLTVYTFLHKQVMRMGQQIFRAPTSKSSTSPTVTSGSRRGW